MRIIEGNIYIIGTIFRDLFFHCRRRRNDTLGVRSEMVEQVNKEGPLPEDLH